MDLKTVKEELIKKGFTEKEIILYIVFPSILAIIVFVPTVLQLIFTILAFIGVHQGSDLQNNTINILQNTNILLNAYKDFNVDSKILIWSLINIGFTLYVYKSFLKFKELNTTTPKIASDSKAITNDNLSCKTSNPKTLPTTDSIVKMNITASDSKNSPNNELSNNTSKTAFEIHSLLKKYNNQSFFKTSNIINPETKIVIGCTKPNSFALIPFEAVNELKKLSFLKGVKIEFDNSVKINDLTSSEITYRYLPDKHYSQIEHNTRMTNASYEILRLFREENIKQQNLTTFPDIDPLNNKITVRIDKDNELPQEFIDKLKKLESKLQINIDLNKNF